MSMIFPGMDPYLENPIFWQGFHGRFVVHIADRLQPLIRPRYNASTEDRVVVKGAEPRQLLPDVWIKTNRETGNMGAAVLEAEAPLELIVPETEVRQRFIEILDREAGQRVVTVIEVISPWNKYFGSTRDQYVRKQLDVRNSQAHLVEIDLLRTGPHVLPVPEWDLRAKGAYDYAICINPAEEFRERFLVYLRLLRHRLPRITIPLAQSDKVILDLQEVLAYSYDIGGYRDRLGYDRPCEPPLSPEDQAWADELIRAAKAADGNP